MSKKKNILIPEENIKIEIPEDDGLDALVWMKKTRTNSFGPLGDYWENKIYQVPFRIFLEFHKLGEAELSER